VHKLPLERTALLVHDVQNDFCSPGGKIYDRAGPAAATSIDPFLNVLEALLAAARDAGVRPIYIKNTHLTDAADLPDVSSMGDVPVLAGTWGHQVVDRVAPIAGDIVVEKSGFDIFRYSMLDKVVRARRLQAFVLAGVSTHSGVLASHFALRDLGYSFVVAREAVTAHDHALHEAALAIMAPYVVDAGSLLELWKPRNGEG
jgi:nicotinamidase-related amidase